MDGEWLKITRGRSGGRGVRRKSPAVSRSAKSPDSAYMSLPEGIVEGERVSVFISGNKLGFLFGEEGEFAVRETDKNTKIRRVNIPSAVAQIVPIGVHEVEFEDGPNGMKIIDFDKLNDKIASQSAESNFNSAED